MAIKDEVKEGQVFGNFKIVKELDRIIIPSGQTNRVFLCECVCGVQKNIRYVHLKNNRIKSCGCSSFNYHNKKDPKIMYIRKIWRAIKYRTSKDYFESHLYYDKGVRVCDEWLNDFNSFLHWALENGLSKGSHIDRINGLEGYSANNCRVVSPVENANNRINTFNVYYNGERFAFMDLLRIKGLVGYEYAIRTRIKRGWSCEMAIDTPIRIGSYKKKLKELKHESK